MTVRAVPQTLMNDIRSNAELLQRAEELTVRNRRELLTKGDTEVIVIGYFSRQVWVDEEVIKEEVVDGRLVATTEKAKVQKTAITVIYSCKLVLLWVLALHGLGFTFDLQADGTYRCVSFSFFALYFNDRFNVDAPALVASRTPQANERGVGNHCRRDDARNLGLGQRQREDAVPAHVTRCDENGVL